MMMVKIVVLVAMVTMMVVLFPDRMSRAAAPAAGPLQVANGEERAEELRKQLAKAAMQTAAAVSARDEVGSELSRIRLQLKQQEASAAGSPGAEEQEALAMVSEALEKLRESSEREADLQETVGHLEARLLEQEDAKAAAEERVGELLRDLKESVGSCKRPIEGSGCPPGRRRRKERRDGAALRCGCGARCQG